MSAAPAAVPEDESARQAALDGYAIVDTPREGAFDDLVRLATVVSGAGAAAVAFVDRDRVWFKASLGFDTDRLPRAASFTADVVQARALIVVEDARREPSRPPVPVRLGGRPPRFYAGAPLIHPDGHAIGALCVADAEPQVFGPRPREALVLLARQAVHLLERRRSVLEQNRRMSESDALARRVEQAHAELEHRHARLLHSARRDELTGLLNRTGLAQLLEDPAHAQRLETGGYCLILLDIDHFKQVNDRHGHLLGDRALRLVADAVHGAVREGDLAVRYGGEEFLIVLPGTDLASAAEIAHRIRERVSQVTLPFPLSVSAGVAAGDAGHDRPEQVFDRADQALYRAKAGGRDRVVVDDTLRV